MEISLPEDFSYDTHKALYSESTSTFGKYKWQALLLQAFPAQKKTLLFWFPSNNGNTRNIAKTISQEK